MAFKPPLPTLRLAPVWALVGISDATSVPLQELGKLRGVKKMLPEPCMLRAKRVNVCLEGVPREGMDFASDIHSRPHSRSSVDVP